MLRTYLEHVLSDYRVSLVQADTNLTKNVLDKEYLKIRIKDLEDCIKYLERILENKEKENK